MKYQDGMIRESLRSRVISKITVSNFIDSMKAFMISFFFALPVLIGIPIIYGVYRWSVLDTFIFVVFVEICFLIWVISGVSRESGETHLDVARQWLDVFVYCGFPLILGITLYMVTFQKYPNLSALILCSGFVIECILCLLIGFELIGVDT